jgi:hypothetical protein
MYFAVWPASIVPKAAEVFGAGIDIEPTARLGWRGVVHDLAPRPSPRIKSLAWRLLIFQQVTLGSQNSEYLHGGCWRG